MIKYNPTNERIKRRYFTYLKEAKGYSVETIDAVAAALNRYETYTKYKDFKIFHQQMAVAFKEHLVQQRNPQTDQLLSKSTLSSTLKSLKNFYHWLAGMDGYKSRLRYSDSEFFNLNMKDERIAHARREAMCPSLEQIKHVIAMMPFSTEIEMRNRAVVAFILLTGARDSAVASLKLKHVDLSSRRVYQDAREVNTKNSKTITTFFFNVGEEIELIVIDWITYLKQEKLWGYDDPLFPRTLVAPGKDHQFKATELNRKHWKTAATIRRIFKSACENAGLPYFNPHSLRNTLARLGQQICKTPEDFKAWSQNLGHEKVLTTMTSYGNLSIHEQSEIINRLQADKENKEVDLLQLAEEFMRWLKINNIDNGLF